MSGWLERFGTVTAWCKGCPICAGQTFLDLSVTDRFSLFRGENVARCPCWILYQAAQLLWQENFMRGYVAYDWNSLYPLVPEELDPAKLAAWKELFPNDRGMWSFSEADFAALDLWIASPDLVADRGLSLVLYGAKGCGKTALATAIAKEYVKRRGIDGTGWKTGWRPMFLVTDHLFDHLAQRSWKNRDLVEMAHEAPLLVLDDFRLMYTGYVQVEFLERLHSILQFRAGSLLPTIITINKIGETADFTPNSVTEFLGFSKTELPKKFGRYRYVDVANEPIRPASPWSV